MATTLPAASPAAPIITARDYAFRGYVAAVLIAATCPIIGVIWDISWHRSIGRDTFWTPAHLLIQASGIIGGLACGWLVLKTTFAGTPEERAAGVAFWGFRGPLGAWVIIWGALAMVLSAPFDNWWHDAYGLDVRVLSPPHAILGLGFMAIELGALLMVTSIQNRAGEARERMLASLVIYGAGLLLTNNSIFIFEYAGSGRAHGGVYYIAAALAFPVVLTMSARAARVPWPATLTALVYMTVSAVMVWILPLFPATPRLAPVFRPLTHMAPAPFQLFLVIPAAGVDWLVRRWQRRNDWIVAAGVGLAFVALLLVTQWFFSGFLVSPASHNWFFGANRWSYNSRPAPDYQFADVDAPALLLRRLAIAAGAAILTSRLGLALGKWMARVRR